MKNIALMVILVCALFTSVINNTNINIIAYNYDSLGLVIKVREKYGPVFLDTGNILYTNNTDLILSTRDGIKSIYSKSNYSITIMRK